MTVKGQIMVTYFQVVVSHKWCIIHPYDQSLNEILILYRNEVRITRLAHRMPYRVIICLNSHEKLTKTEICLDIIFSQFEFI